MSKNGPQAYLEEYCHNQVSQAAPLATVNYQQLGLSRQHRTGHQHLYLSLRLSSQTSTHQSLLFSLFFSHFGRPIFQPKPLWVDPDGLVIASSGKLVRTFQPDNSVHHQLIHISREVTKKLPFIFKLETLRKAPNIVRLCRKPVEHGIIPEVQPFMM